MRTERMQNPYQPPTTALNALGSTDSSLKRLLTLPAVVTVAGIVMCSAGMYFFFTAYRLRHDFPDLEDHSPNVDWYWPSVAHTVANIFGTATATVGIVMLLVAFLIYR